MANGWDDHQERRREDREFASWRGEISTMVRAHDREVGILNDRLNGIASVVTATKQDVAVLQTTMRDQAKDIAKQQASNTRILLYLIFPFIVAILAGLILFAVTGSLGVHH